MVKYEKEIDEVLDLMTKDMDKPEKEEFIKIVLLINSKEKISKDLQTGVDNGYSVEDQVILLKKTFKIMDGE